MNRVTSYGQFAIGFVGAGYAALWPLTAHDGATAGLGVVCESWVAMAAAACQVADGLRLSPGLHLAGQVAGLCLALRLGLIGLRRLRRPVASAMPAKRTGRLIAALDRYHPRPPPRRRVVKPRRQFGLRGLPR